MRVSAPLVEAPLATTAAGAQANNGPRRPRSLGTIEDGRTKDNEPAEERNREARPPDSNARLQRPSSSAHLAQRTKRGPDATVHSRVSSMHHPSGLLPADLQSSLSLLPQAIIAEPACDQTTIHAWPCEHFLLAPCEHFHLRRLRHDTTEESCARKTNRTEPNLHMN